MKKFFPLIFFIFIATIFFLPYLFNNKSPIPSDTIIGLYHPFRDLYADSNPNGIVYKNFLITDPVRQQIPWKYLSVELLRNLEIPSWNPYSLSGAPLAANFQSAVFYPLNILFYIFPFQLAWGILIFFQPILMGFFLFLYLRNLKINAYASLLGGLVFAYSGFSIAWLTWGTIGHTALWLPLVLLSIDKIYDLLVLNISNINNQRSKIQIKNKRLFAWTFILTASLSASLFGGHLQTFFYLFLLIIAYTIVRWLHYGRPKKSLWVFASCYLIFVLITSVQWLPTLQLINLSARNLDLDWQTSGWFIPWQNLIQFIAPDFFGNPATLNYWGVWNYGEFIGYIGIMPLALALFSLFYRYDRKTFFFGSILFISLIFSLPTFLAKIPYVMNIPFISTAQPTRLIFLTDFSLAILAAFGLDKLIKKYKSTQLIPSILFLSIVIALLWGVVIFNSHNMLEISESDLIVASRNLILPTILIGISVLLLLSWHIFSNKKYANLILVTILIVSVFDLFRFGLKFTPFTDRDYFFPNTKVIDFLQKHSGINRSMSLDDRILPPNFSVIYKLQFVDNYDPLYLRRYAELIAAIERNKPNISPPFGFNRIITPKNFNSELIDVMGVKYILSLKELKSDKLNKVFAEGQTIVYENINVFDRAFFVEDISPASSKEEAIRKMFDPNINFRKTAIVENWDNRYESFASGSASISQYDTNRIEIDVNVGGLGFMVLTDTYYPTWRVKICDLKLGNCKNADIYLTNYNFRGVIVPRGTHKVVFENHLL